MQCEAEVCGEVGDRALGESATGVTHRGQRLRGDLLDVREVVVLLTHGPAQLDVRTARGFRGGGETLVATAQLVVQCDDVLEDVGRDAGARPQRRQPERREDAVALRSLQRDLQ